MPKYKDSPEERAAKEARRKQIQELPRQTHELKKCEHPLQKRLELC